VELDERFIASLRSLDINADSSCIIALSGGGDSVALLDLAAKAHLNCSAARVIHRIRDSISEKIENTLCERLCAERNISFHVLSAENDTVHDIRRRFGCGIEQAARVLRHRLLRDHMRVRKAQYIFYGHTSDDSLETIFMRLLSGSGAEGLGGIPALRGETVRPLLSFKRAELREYLVSNSIDWIEDASNSSKIHRRNRIRNELIPLISDIFPGWPKALSVLGERSQEATLALKKLCYKELNPIVECDRYMWNEGDWDSAAKYSKALALWNAFNYLDNSKIPDRRIPWRALKEARKAADSRRAWNSHGFKLIRKPGVIEISRADSRDALGNSGGRIILSRSEVRRGFVANIGSYDIVVSLQKPNYPGIVSSCHIENWPLEIRFGSYGMEVGPLVERRTKTSFPKGIADSGKEMIYILIEKSRVELDVR